MIEINNLTKSEIDEKFLKKIAEIVLKKEKRSENLSIAFVGPGRMKKLNKKYRGKNRVTDVLAFPETKTIFRNFGEELQKKIQGIGEIVICPKRVKKNAKRFGVAFREEISRVLIHGILHLLGYDHEKSEKEAKEMKEKEDFYLSHILKNNL